MSPDQTRAHAAATIAAQAGDLRSGHDSPTGWLVAELDAARQMLRIQRVTINELKRQVAELDAARQTIRAQRRHIAALEAALDSQHREDADHAREVATGGRIEAGPLLAHMHDDGLL